MLCAHLERGELRLFHRSPHFPGGPVARGTTKKCAVDEEVCVKSVDGSLICGGDLGKCQLGKSGVRNKDLQ